MVPPSSRIYLLILFLVKNASSTVSSTKSLPKILEPCLGLEVNSSEGTRIIDVGGFYFRIPVPVDSNRGRSYGFRCEGGKMNFCQPLKRIVKACPIVRVGSRRTVSGKITVPPISYDLTKCQYSAGNYTVTGDVHGTTEGVDVNFKIATSGLRHFCHVSPPRMKKNLAFFPKKYFNTEASTIEGLNNRFIREGIVKAINDHLTAHVANLTGKFKCRTFFKIER